MQAPADPASAHASQAPPHARSQHTPPAHTREVHWALVVQGRPRPKVARQVGLPSRGSRLQYCPATQSASTTQPPRSFTMTTPLDAPPAPMV